MDTHDIKVGRVYAAAKSTPIRGLLNDRQVKWISSDRAFVQYDGPAVGFGRHYPRIPMGRFATWAHKDVTDEMPENGEWRAAPDGR